MTRSRIPYSAIKNNMLFEKLHAARLNGNPAEVNRCRWKAIEYNRPLALSIANSFVLRPGAERSDILGMAYIGLTRGVDTFDVELGLQPSSFLFPVITYEILGGLAAECKSFGISQYLVGTLFRARSSQLAADRAFIEFSGRSYNGVVRRMAGESFYDEEWKTQRVREDTEKLWEEYLNRFNAIFRGHVSLDEKRLVYQKEQAQFVPVDREFGFTFDYLAQVYADYVSGIVENILRMIEGKNGKAWKSAFYLAMRLKDDYAQTLIDRYGDDDQKLRFHLLWDVRDQEKDFFAMEKIASVMPVTKACVSFLLQRTLDKISKAPEYERELRKLYGYASLHGWLDTVWPTIPDHIDPNHTDSNYSNPPKPWGFDKWKETRGISLRYYDYRRF